MWSATLAVYNQSHIEAKSVNLGFPRVTAHGLLSSFIYWRSRDSQDWLRESDPKTAIKSSLCDWSSEASPSPRGPRRLLELLPEGANHSFRGGTALIAAAFNGHESVVTTLITHRLGLWVPVWQRSLSGLQREGLFRPRGPAPLGGMPLKPFWKGGVSLPLDHSGADLNRAEEHGL